MSGERSAEWLRGAIAVCDDVGQQIAAAIYRKALAAADAREATQPTAAEVIADAEKALRKLTNEIGNIEVLGEYEALNINTGLRKNMRARIDGVEVECREALALCARWKEANGDPA